MLLSIQEVEVVPWLSKSEQRIQAKRQCVPKVSKMVMMTAFDARTSWTQSTLLGKDDILELRKRQEVAKPVANMQSLSGIILECLVVDAKWEGGVEGSDQVNLCAESLGFDFGGQVWAQS